MGLAKPLSCKSWSMRLLPRWNIGIPMMTAVNKIGKEKYISFWHVENIKLLHVSMFYIAENKYLIIFGLKILL